MTVRATCRPRVRPRIGASALVIALLAASCSDGANRTVDGSADSISDPVVTTRPVDDDPDGTLPLADHPRDEPDVTSVATELAPSQRSAATVPGPPTPPPCTPDDVDLWTARVEGDGPTVDAVIRVRNVGAAWCEADIGRSPQLDPAVEPDVWLLPDEAADLRVGENSSGCADPALVTRLPVGIGTGSVVVPSSVVTCGWWLDALVPLEPVTDSCRADGLAVSVTDSAVVVRTEMGPCRLGALVTADRDDGIDVRVDRTASGLAFDVLYPGDVAQLGSVTGSVCDDAVRSVVLDLGETGDLTVAEVPCAMRFPSGAATPWFGSESGPTSDVRSGRLDPERVLAALDPFAPSA